MTTNNLGETQMGTALSTDAKREMVTLWTDELLLGIDIREVQEINRQLAITTVPKAPDVVRGVVNLRGEVVTVLDLRTVLEFERAEVTAASRNIVVQSQGERVGLMVDRVGDVVTVAEADVEPPPANSSGIEARFLTGVCKMESELLGILDIDAVMSLGESERLAKTA